MNAINIDASEVMNRCALFNSANVAFDYDTEVRPLDTISKWPVSLS